MISETSIVQEEDSRFAQIEILGSGTYGDVYKVICKKSGELRALKKLKHVNDNQNGGIDPIIIREIVLLSDLSNKNIVKLIEVISESHSIMLVFEFMKGSLDSFIKLLKLNDEISGSFNFLNCDFFPIKETELIRVIYNILIQYIFKQLIEGLKYIHLKNIIHRDLKPANILIDYNGKSLKEVINQALIQKINKTNDSVTTPSKKEKELHLCSTETSIMNLDDNTPKIKSLKLVKYDSLSELKIKIADFGLARLANTNKCIPYTRNLVTLWYRAPELLMNHSTYDEGVDIWSLGCIFAEIILGFPIFKGDNEVDQLNKIFSLNGTPNSVEFMTHKFKFHHYQKQNLRDYIKNYNPFIDDAAIDLIKLMLQTDNEDRIKTLIANKHEFFNKDFVIEDIYWK